MSLLGRILGSEERALSFIDATGTRPALERLVRWLNRVISNKEA